MRALLILTIAVIVFVSEVQALRAETVFTHLARSTKDDPRQDYHIELLRLALDKTVGEYGPYKLVPAPDMNASRLAATLKSGQLPNFFANESVTMERLKEFGYVPFPILRGIVGYRVFFVSPAARERLKSVKNLEGLRTFSMGQGLGWLDTKILKHNGFGVVVGSSYEGLFSMVAANRFDLFPRSIGEVIREYETYKERVNLTLDDSLALYYPLPRFFFTHKSNTDSKERVTKGLLAAYEDGSFLDLWNKFHLEDIKRLNMEKRTIFELENPYLSDIDKGYEKFFYRPQP